jgi:hypothetical protein
MLVMGACERKSILFFFPGHPVTGTAESLEQTRSRIARRCLSSSFPISGAVFHAATVGPGFFHSDGFTGL